MKHTQQQLAYWNVQHHRFQNIVQKKTPSRNKYSDVWFNLPVQASTFTPNDGTAQLCNTSAAVTNTLIWVF